MSTHHRFLCVNVDLDSLSLYCALHGVPRELASEAVYDVAIPRFIELFGELGISATFFVVGEDVQRGQNAAQIKALVAAGHEIANHTMHHPYDLTYWPPTEIAQEIARAHEVLTEAAGAPPVGFRAPGYNVSAAVFRVLRQLGYRYDSSILPSPPYILAKYAVIGGMRLVGKRSASVFGNPLQMFASTAPRRRRDGLWEFPVSVLPGLRVPVIGTTLAVFGRQFAAVSAKALRGQTLVNLEFHGVDLLDLQDGDVPRQLGVQRDLRIPLQRKRATYHHALKILLESRTCHRLDDLARSPVEI